MKNHSIYTALYNANKMQFPWRDALDNWTRFLGSEGQISIAINTSEDDTFESVAEFVRELSGRPGNQIEYAVFKTNVPYSDPLFDGKIKNEALRRCNREFCTLLDIDEVLPLHNRGGWEDAKHGLASSRYDALFVPVIDLFNDIEFIKGIGQKWYLHRNKPNLRRGRVSFAAREDGSTDISRSDTCELIYDNGQLVNAVALFGMHMTESRRLSMMRNNELPYVVHTGWLSREQRLRQSAFWAPVWTARDGIKVEKPLTEQDLDKIPYFPHGLKHWNEE